MARCSSCNMFCSVELQEPEADLEVNDEGLVTGTVRLLLSSECCSEEVAEANVDLEIDTQLEHDEKCGDQSVVIDDESADATDRYQTTDRHGNHIKSLRYQRHFYGADIAVAVRCVVCSAEAQAKETAEEQASSFEEMW